MPNIKSAIKRVKVSEKKRERNRALKSQARTMVTHVRRDLVGGHVQEAEQDSLKAQSALDKAAFKGAIHRNAAARRKSRMMKALAKAARSDQG